jgi:DNA (cytosine-5)-methyltransferase 1
MRYMKINQLDLFSGIGGFHLGFERAGYEVTSYFSEIDQHAIAVYKHQFPTSTYVGSVTNVRGADLPRIDLITFGSPCQDFSLAGKRLGMEGQRSSLVLEAIRLISECRPSVFVWENVKGTFSSNDGADFWAIIQAFTDIGGYRLEWQLLNTSWFLPQNRERIYLVGYSTTTGGDWRGVFPIATNNQEADSNTQCSHQSAQTLTARYFASTAQGTYIGERDKVRRLTPIECERLQGFPDNHTAFGNYDGVVKPMSNTQRYKQCGNAVTVDVVAAVAKNCLPLFKTNQQ